MKSTRFLPFAAALFAIPAPAQAPAPQSQTVVKIDNKPNYSGEPSLFERLDRVYTYAADGTGSRTITGVIRVQTDAAVKQLSVINFPFASASEHVALDYLRVVHPDGSITATPCRRRAGTARARHPRSSVLLRSQGRTGPRPLARCRRPS